MEKGVHGGLFGARVPRTLIDSGFKPFHRVGDDILEGALELVTEIGLGLCSCGRRRTVLLCIQEVGHRR